jgi:hypothetical protein
MGNTAFPGAPMQLSMSQSPAPAQMQLPDGSSPMMQMGMTPQMANMVALGNNMGIQGSPALAGAGLPGGGPPGATPMQLQASQQGSTGSGVSTNTSPNTTNKRRRASVKEESGDVNGSATGGAGKVKPSPRIGGKRQKANPA